MSDSDDLEIEPDLKKIQGNMRIRRPSLQYGLKSGFECAPEFIDELFRIREEEYMSIKYFDNCFHESVEPKPFRKILRI